VGTRLNSIVNRNFILILACTYDYLNAAQTLANAAAGALSASEQLNRLTNVSSLALVECEYCVIFVSIKSAILFNF